MEQKLKQIKYLGAAGFLLPLFSWVPAIGWLAVIASFILQLVAIKQLSDVTQKKEIFRNFLISLILGFLAIGVVIVGVFSVLGIGATRLMTGRQILRLLGSGALLVVLVSWLLTVAAGYFYWQSFKKIKEQVNVNLFGTAGIVYFIGSILTIVLVGFLLSVGSCFLTVIAFFSLPDSLPSKS